MRNLFCRLRNHSENKKDVMEDWKKEELTRRGGNGEFDGGGGLTREKAAV